MDMEMWREALKGVMVAGEAARMNPGKQRWGLSCRDGSDLKNTNGTVYSHLCPTSSHTLTLAILLLLYFTSKLLLSLASTFFTFLFMFSHRITTSLSPLFVLY